MLYLGRVCINFILEYSNSCFVVDCTLTTVFVFLILLVARFVSLGDIGITFETVVSKEDSEAENLADGWTITSKHRE